MLSMSDTSIAAAATIFNSLDIEVTFLVPTETGMVKSIMDAHQSVQDFLQRHKVHDYSSQKQGTDNKVVMPSELFSDAGPEQIDISLYRPISKSGDPRIWLYRLRQLAQPNNLIALTWYQGQIVAVNCSNKGIDHFKALVIATQRSTNYLTGSANGDELLQLLKEIHNRGYIENLASGPRSVGTTLETLLGIDANSSREPDYKGIEVKAKASLGTRQTLISLKPDWDHSPIGGPENLLNKHGRPTGDEGRLRLYHNLSGSKINTYDLALRVDNDSLEQVYVRVRDSSVREPELIRDKARTEVDSTWPISLLTSRLAVKHDETFFVRAKKKTIRGSDHFEYQKVLQMSRPNLSMIGTLLDTGVMELDYTLSFKANGKTRDHGYLFKMKNRDLGALFRNATEFYLATV